MERHQTARAKRRIRGARTSNQESHLKHLIRQNRPGNPQNPHELSRGEYRLGVGPGPKGREVGGRGLVPPAPHLRRLLNHQSEQGAIQAAQRLAAGLAARGHPLQRRREGRGRVKSVLSKINLTISLALPVVTKSRGEPVLSTRGRPHRSAFPLPSQVKRRSGRRCNRGRRTRASLGKRAIIIRNGQRMESPGRQEDSLRNIPRPLKNRQRKPEGRGGDERSRELSWEELCGEAGR